MATANVGVNVSVKTEVPVHEEVPFPDKRAAEDVDFGRLKHLADEWLVYRAVRQPSGGERASGGRCAKQSIHTP